jgi:hypothetical protein
MSDDELVEIIQNYMRESITLLTDIRTELEDLNDKAAEVQVEASNDESA